MSEQFHILDAFVDGEAVDPSALRQALADEAGRDYLIDAWLLRDLVQEEIAGDELTAPAARGATRAALARGGGGGWGVTPRWLSGRRALPGTDRAGPGSAHAYGGRARAWRIADASDCRNAAGAWCDGAAGDASDPARAGSELEGNGRGPLMPLMLDAVVVAMLVAQQAAEAGRALERPHRLCSSSPRRCYQPDGSVSADTAVLAGTAPHVVHVAGRSNDLRVAVAGAAEPREVAFGWRVTSQTLSATPTAVVVSIDWQRLWDRGQEDRERAVGHGATDAASRRSDPARSDSERGGDRRVPCGGCGARGPAGAVAGAGPAGGQHVDPARRRGRRGGIARCRSLARAPAPIGRRTDASSDGAADGGRGDRSVSHR